MSGSVDEDVDEDGRRSQCPSREERRNLQTSGSDKGKKFGAEVSCEGARGGVTKKPRVVARTTQFAVACLVETLLPLL